MKKSFINNVNLMGILYEHNLTLKETGANSKNPGTEFISGTIGIATDDAITNIVQVHFTYVTATNAKGGANATFSILKDIINGVLLTYMDNPDKAVRLIVDSAIGLNEFYSNRSGTEELVSVKRNEGGFIHIVKPVEWVDDELKRNRFKCDMVITNVRHVEADEEKEIPEKVIVKGAIFDFRKSLLPVEFVATDPSAMAYFEGLNASNANPVFTAVWGKQVSEVVKRVIRTESAFGEDDVREVQSTRKEYLITGGSKEPYAWDDSTTLTAQELTEMMANRQTYLATIKQRQDEYQASRNSNATTAPRNATGGFNF